MMRHSVTVFTVSSIEESTKYCRDRLGFEVAFESGQLRRPQGRQRRATRNRLVAENHGIRDFDVTELDGNMIYFGKSLQR